MGYAHAAPCSDTRARPQRKITALEFTRIDVDPNPEPDGKSERDDIVNATAVDVTEPSPAISQPTGAITAVIAIDKGLRHIVEQDAAARFALGRDERQDGSYRLDGQVVGDAFPQEQRPRSGCVTMTAQCLAKILAFEVDRNRGR